MLEFASAAGEPGGGSVRSEGLTSFDPRTGEVVASFAVATSSTIARLVRESRAAQRWWGGLSFADRRRMLLSWKRYLASKVTDLAELISAETGKPSDDALIEVMHAIEHLDWAARNAGRVLGRRTLHTGPMGRANRASVGYLPYGVVGVIGPSNYPLYTPMGSIAYAMAAGNAVVFKPSELTPAVGVWLAESWRQIDREHPVLHTVAGDHRTGVALVKAGVDKVSFAGSPGAARRVLALCAESMTPVVIEGGGKDAMLVRADAKLDAAAEAAVYGAMLNAGQTAAAVERVYVAESVYEPFLELVIAKAATLRAGGDGGASYGPMTRENTVDVVRRHVRDALERGGRAVVGGLHSFREPFIEPIVLVDVPEDSIAVTEETYGPVLVVNKIRSVEEAVQKINATGFGMAVSIFTADIDGARDLADTLRVGAVTVNSVFGFAGAPAVPIGGVGESGYGRLHGDDGLREFARTQAVVRKRARPWLDLYRMDRKPRHVRLAKALFLRRHARSR